jgi:hypothetical protein
MSKYAWRQEIIRFSDLKRIFSNHNRMEPEVKKLERQLAEALDEIESLKAENRALTHKLGITPKQDLLPTTDTIPAEAGSNLTVEEKIRLFRSLFKGREDVYPARWDNKKTGRSGYSPVCGNEWVKGICDKPRIKCSDCPNQKFLPVADQVIYDHLAGKKTVGVYPLLENENCHFVAADFDKEHWLDDARAFLEACRDHEIDAILERSRSGKGGHVWIFFEHPVAASMARRLGSFLLTKAMEKRHQVGLDSYDRLFPSQDTMPKGGFGNLIALPLQKDPRSRGNSTFINDNGNLFEYPWVVLAQVKKTDEMLVHRLLDSVGFHGEVGDIQLVAEEDEPATKPWERSREKSKPQKIKGPFPERARVVQADLIYVEKNGLPTAMLDRILRIAAFQNPEFYRAQAMRLSASPVSTSSARR